MDRQTDIQPGNMANPTSQLVIDSATACQLEARRRRVQRCIAVSDEVDMDIELPDIGRPIAAGYVCSDVEKWNVAIPDESVYRREDGLSLVHFEDDTQLETFWNAMEFDKMVGRTAAEKVVVHGGYGFFFNGLSVKRPERTRGLIADLQAAIEQLDGPLKDSLNKFLKPLAQGKRKKWSLEQLNLLGVLAEELPFIVDSEEHLSRLMKICLLLNLISEQRKSKEGMCESKDEILPRYNSVCADCSEVLSSSKEQVLSLLKGMFESILTCEKSKSQAGLKKRVKELHEALILVHKLIHENLIQDREATLSLVPLVLCHVHEKQTFLCSTASKNSETSKRRTTLLDMRALQPQLQTLVSLRNILKCTMKQIEKDGVPGHVNHNQLWAKPLTNTQRLAAAGKLIDSAMTQKFALVQDGEALFWRPIGECPVRSRYSFYVYNALQEINNFVNRMKICNQSSTSQRSPKLDDAAVTKVRQGLQASKLWVKEAKKVVHDLSPSMVQVDENSISIEVRNTVSTKLFHDNGLSMCKFQLHVHRFTGRKNVIVVLSDDLAWHDCNVKSSLRAQNIPAKWMEFIEDRMRHGLCDDGILQLVTDTIHGSKLPQALAFSVDHLPEDCGRMIGLSKNQLAAIRQRIGLNRRLHQNDDRDFHMLLTEHNKAVQQGKDKPFFLAYQPYQQANHLDAFGLDGVANLLADTDELFICFASEFMLRLASRHGSICYCDATHSVTQKTNVKLLTIMVVTERNQGFPVMWALSKTETTGVYAAMFRILKQRLLDIGQGLDVKVIMSDKCEAPFNGAKIGLKSKSIKWFHCTFHVLQNVQQALNKHYKSGRKTGNEKQRRINALFSAFRRLLYAGTPEEFNIKKIEFFRMLHEGGEQTELEQYFIKEFFRNHLIQRWAIWCRQDLPRASNHACPSSNDHVESYHSTLKDKFFPKSVRVGEVLRKMQSVDNYYKSKYGKEAANLGRSSLLHLHHEKEIAASFGIVLASDENILVTSKLPLSHPNQTCEQVRQTSTQEEIFYAEVVQSLKCAIDRRVDTIQSNHLKCIKMQNARLLSAGTGRRVLEKLDEVSLLLQDAMNDLGKHERALFRDSQLVTPLDTERFRKRIRQSWNNRREDERSAARSRERLKLVSLQEIDGKENHDVNDVLEEEDILPLPKRVRVRDLEKQTKVDNGEASGVLSADTLAEELSLANSESNLARLMASENERLQKTRAAIRELAKSLPCECRFANGTLLTAQHFASLHEEPDAEIFHAFFSTLPDAGEEVQVADSFLWDKLFTAYLQEHHDEVQTLFYSLKTIHCTAFMLLVPVQVFLEEDKPVWTLVLWDRQRDEAVLLTSFPSECVQKLVSCLTFVGIGERGVRQEKVQIPEHRSGLWVAQFLFSITQVAGKEENSTEDILRLAKVDLFDEPEVLFKISKTLASKQNHVSQAELDVCNVFRFKGHKPPKLTRHTLFKFLTDSLGIQVLMSGSRDHFMSKIIQFGMEHNIIPRRNQ